MTHWPQPSSPTAASSRASPEIARPPRRYSTPLARTPGTPADRCCGPGCTACTPRSVPAPVRWSGACTTPARRRTLCPPLARIPSGWTSSIRRGWPASWVVAGRTADAQVSLQQALEQLDERAGKQRAVVLLDLATAHAAADPAHGMTLAGQALDLLEHEPYGAAYGRIPEVRQALDGTPQAQMLDERVRALPSTIS